MSLACHIKGCLEKTGMSIVCEFHRRRMSEGQARKMAKMWHDIVADKGRHGDLYMCKYCETLFPRNEVCGDHVLPKSVRPDLRYDITNGVCCCAMCNDKARIPTKQKL